MRPTVEAQYRDLLNPVKDPEKSFAIDIAQLLQDYVSELVRENRTPNFNSAALLLQGSASIYGKKVEYLHNLATQLYHSLIRHKDADQPSTSKKETKEKEKKEDKANDPFLSTEIKMGKNLSCLKRKNAPKASTKKLQAKQMKNSGIPVLMVTTDNEEKGELFNDTRGEPIGNTGDYALNLCRLTDSGWLLLPTINPSLVPSPNSIPEYYDDLEMASPIGENCETPGMMDDTGDIQFSPDDGFESQPGSNMPESTQESDLNSQATNTPSQDTPSQDTAPPSTDEGIGSTPMDVIDNSPGEGIENIPTDNEDGNLNDAVMPIRQSVRQALKTCQLALEDDPLCGPGVDKNLIVRRKIQKKNTRILPSKLKMADEDIENCPISEYCARTFFSMDDRNLKNSLLAFDVDGFDQNSKFMKRIREKIDALKLTNRKNKRVIDPIEDEREIDVEGIECLKDGDEDNDDTLCVPFDDADVQIDNDPNIRPSAPAEDIDDPGPSADDGPIEAHSPDISHIAFEECERYTKEVQHFIQNSDITERVHEWERCVKPFLDIVDKRESFDINLYGFRILNSFEDNNRKQTITFKQFCKNKEKWEIHRYFMALLPLANIGNVRIDAERMADGSDKIYVTLLSRKMHHKELEEFGHSEGSHS